jgi:hypothetical protein
MALKFKHIGKFKVMFELALGYEQGTGGIDSWKKLEVEDLVRLSF